MTQEQTSGKRDLLDSLLGVTPDSPLAQLRAKRANLAQFTQDSYDALLDPQELGGLSTVEREKLALRSALLAPSAKLAAHYRERLVASGVSAEEIAAVENYPNDGPLSEREKLLLAYTDLLSTHPVDGTPADLEPLLNGGFSNRDIVTVSQLVSFISYQARILASLRALQEAL